MFQLNKKLQVLHTGGQKNRGVGRVGGSVGGWVGQKEADVLMLILWPVAFYGASNSHSHQVSFSYVWFWLILHGCGAGVREADEVFWDRRGLDPKFWQPETGWLSTRLQPASQLGKLQEEGGQQSEHAREQILKDLHLYAAGKGGQGEGGETRHCSFMKRLKNFIIDTWPIPGGWVDWASRDVLQFDVGVGEPHQVFSSSFFTNLSKFFMFFLPTSSDHVRRIN